MATIQELLASGQLYNPAGTVNPRSGRNSIAALMNSGTAMYGGPGLDIPNWRYRSLIELPKLYTGGNYIQTGESGGYVDPESYVPISYQDAIAKNFQGVGYGNVDENSRYWQRPSANLGDIYAAAGLDSPQLRDYVTKSIQGGGGLEYGAYAPNEVWDSLQNDLSGYNAADDREFNTNSLLALSTVLSAGTLNNMYGAGATTTGIGEVATPAYGTDLSAVDAFNAGDIFYGSGPTAESGGFLTGMGEGGGGLFGNTTLDVTQFPASGKIFNTGGGSSSASGGGMFETLREWFPAISAGSSLVSGLLGYNAAGDAADAQREGAAGATAEARRQFDTVRADTAPYRAAGVMSLDALGKLLGLVPGYSPESELIKTPGYQFRLGQGDEALTNIQSKGGYRLGGRAVKEAVRYNQDYATGEYGNAVDRLFRLGGFGTSGVGTSASAGANAANTAANASIAAGNAGAAGSYGQASAINNSIQGGLQNYLTWDMYNRFAA